MIDIDGRRPRTSKRSRPEERSRLRRLMQMVFQDPYSALNPRHSVRRGLAEALRAGACPAEDFETRV